MFSDGYNHNHRCDRCGCRYGDHKYDDNACPPTKSYGIKIPLKTEKVKDEHLDKYIAEYWAKSEGTFLPRS